jgi:hypothetical protein
MSWLLESPAHEMIRTDIDLDCEEVRKDWNKLGFRVDMHTLSQTECTAVMPNLAISKCR